MPRRKKILIAVALLAALFLVTTGVILPEVIERQAVAWVAGNTERQLMIGDVDFNPFNGKLTIADLRLTEPASGEIFLSYDRLVFDVNISSVWRRALIVDRLQLFSPTVTIVKLGNDRFNFSDFYARTEGAGENAGAAPLQFAISNFIVRNGSVDYLDSDKPEVRHTVRDFELALPFFGNTPALADEFVQPRLSLKIDDAPFAVEGEAKPFADSLEATLQIKLDNIDLPFYADYLPRKRPVEIESGSLAVDLDLSYKVTRDREARLLLGGDLVLTGVSVVDSAGEKVFFLPLAQVSIGWADLLARSAAIEDIAVYGLEVFVRRDAAGDWNHARLARHDAFAGETGGAPVAASGAATSRPHLQVDRFRLRNGIVHFRDEAGKRPFVRQFRDIDIDLSRVDPLSLEPSPFEIAMHVTEPTSVALGRIALTGEAGLDPPRLNSAVNIDRLQLAGIESYFPPEFAGILSGGHADADLNASLALEPATTVTLAGTVGLRDLRLVEPAGGSDVLQWESLQLDGVDLRVDETGPAVRIAEMTLNSYLAKILVTAGGKVNLQQMLAEPVDPEAGQGAPEAAADKVASAVVPRIAIDRVTLQGGTLEFVDQHMPKPFRARFLNLGGRVSGIDSQSETPAVVDLRGNLENRSPLQITGGIRPLGETLFADLKIRFDAIELSPMTPYSGNYLGYAIEKGKLYLDLDYQVDGDRLNAANHVFLDQFTFGQKVASDQATSLPVRLAVALLKDGRGEIRLDLPVTGSLDDPEFSVVGVVFTILKNLLVKAATSPFKLLAAVLGGGDEDFSTVSFPYGVADLQEPEEAKLARLADALQQRPGLKLEVSGYVDRENDPEAWRRVRLETALKRHRHDALKREGKLPEGATVDSMSLNAEERSRYLKQVYKEADFPKPRNALGMVKALPDAEMEKLLFANTPAGEEEMQTLAEARARAVYEHLVQARQLPVERIFLKQDDIYRPPDEKGGSGSRVGFGATVD